MWRWLSGVVLVLWMMVTGVQAQTVNCPGAPESRLVVGEQAEVIVVGGSNLRAFPSVAADLQNVVPFNARIPVLEGPYCSDGYAWWRVQYQGQRGWLAEGTDAGYWLEPYLIVQAQMATYRIETLPEMATGFALSRRENDYTFTLEGYPVTEEDTPAWLRVSVRVPAIPEAELARCVLENPAEITCFEDQIAAKIVPLASINGFRYVTLIEREGRILYRMYALPADARFIQFNAPLAVELELPPFEPPDEDEAREAYITAYREVATEALNGLDDAVFTPAVGNLDTLAQSLQIAVPLTESDLFTFEDERIQLRYNPYLTYQIIGSMVEADETTSGHQRYTLRGYPVAEEATIHLYGTSNLNGAALAQLQQVLARQPRNPPSVAPIPMPEDALSRQESIYLRFNNGDAVRSIVTLADGQRLYHVQGLTDQGDTYFVIRLPLELSGDNYHPPLAVLDTLSESLFISGAN